MRRMLADAEATARAGAALAPWLAAGDVVALIGDLGAGKTTLVAAIARALGCTDVATSPTFALVQRYGGGRLTVWHADLYRLERATELDELGLDDVVGVRTGPTAGVAFVEWGDRFPQVLPASHLRVTLRHVDAARELEAVGVGPRGDELVTVWTRAWDA